MLTKKILIIEDQEILATDYKLALELAGFEIIVSHNGYSALQKLNTSTPDIILLDISLPDINGWEILKLLHVKEHIEKIPVIVISEGDEIRDKIKAIQEGAEDYISRPFKPSDLVKRIQTLLKLKR